MFIWLLALIYLGLAMMFSARWGFGKWDEVIRVRSKNVVFRHSTLRAAILCFVTSCPFLITVGFIIKAYDFYLDHSPYLIGFAILCTLFGALFSYLAAVSNPVEPREEALDHALFQLVLSAAAGFAIVGSLMIRHELPAFVMIVCWIVIVLGILQVVEWAAMQTGLPILTFLILLVLFWSAVDANDNHSIAFLDDPVPTDPTPTPAPDIHSAFQTWIEARREQISAYAAHGRRYLVFIIAAEGGGLRAASMTAQVLDQLVRSCPDALRHTFISIGVSGGSIGAMLASAEIKQNGIKSGCKEDLQNTDEADSLATKVTSEDLLRPVLRGMLFADIPAQLLPSSLPGFSWVGSISDRARYLEKGISDAWRRVQFPPSSFPGFSGSITDWSNYLDKELKETLGVWKPPLDLEHTSFDSLWDGPSGSRPALMLLATDVGSGRRIAVSHVLMPDAAM